MGEGLRGQNIQINRVRPLTTSHLPLGVASFVDFFKSPMNVTVYGSNDPTMLVQDSSIASYTERDGDGWFPLPQPIQGEFFAFTTDLLTSFAQLREITYLEVDYQILGSN